MQSSVEWLVSKLPQRMLNYLKEEIEQAKQMEKEQMGKFAEFVSRYPDKNKNYQGEMLHAKSKYDEAERTIDLLEQYYNETFGGNNE